MSDKIHVKFNARVVSVSIDPIREYTRRYVIRYLPNK